MEHDKYEMMQTKVSKETYDALKKIERKKGISVYGIIQNMCDCVRRYMSDRTNLTPMVEKVMNMFEHMIGWKNNFNLADPSSEPEIAEATYYLTDKNGKPGVRVVHVSRPFFDKWSQTLNVQQILERFLCLTFPGLYMRLRFVAVCRQCNSILELLIDIVGEMESEEDKKELREPFEDAERSEFGREMPKQPFRRHNSRTPDGEALREARQGTINFNDNEDTECKDVRDKDTDL